MRTSYVHGDAWCIVHGDVLAVLDRGIDGAAAAVLHARLVAGTDEGGGVAALRDEPLALAVLEPVDDGWLLWRRRGVPAVGGVELPDRMGEAWASDLVPAATVVAFGAVAQLVDPLPIEGGVVRVGAVRVELEIADAVDEVGSAVATDDDEPEPAPEPAAPEPAPEPEPAAQEPAPALAPEPAAPEPAPEPEPAAQEPAPAPEPAAPEPAAPEPAAPEPLDAPNPTAPIAWTPEPIAPTSEAPTSDAQPSDAQPGDARPSDAQPGGAPPALAPAPPHDASEAAAPTAPTSIAGPTADVRPGITGIIDSVPGFIRPAAVVEVPDLEVGDHDGMTISGDAARDLLAARDQVVGPATGPVVLSNLCEAGHVNPPGRGACECGAQIAAASADQRARPEFAELVLPDGERMPLGRGVVLGRRPRSRRVEDGRVPRLVTLESPNEDISRSHLEVRCEDWNVVALDLESTNGTVLLRDGDAPMRLRPDVPQLLAFGDRLDLGDGVVVRVEAAR